MKVVLELKLSQVYKFVPGSWYRRARQRHQGRSVFCQAHEGERSVAVAQELTF